MFLCSVHRARAPFSRSFCPPSRRFTRFVFLQVTAWPSALTVVMSWDPNAMYEFGRAMGAEQFIKGTNVMLGPAMNLARVPWGGRTFEYTGEDPHLAGIMVAAEIQGVQSNNISVRSSRAHAATPPHCRLPTPPSSSTHERITHPIQFS